MSEFDPCAARRQALNKISSALMVLTYLIDDKTLRDYHRQVIEEVHQDLTRARYLLVEHETPDGILDELSQL